MVTRRHVLLVATVALLALVAGAGWYLGGVAPVATGYAAKTICSDHLVARRTVASSRADLPDNPLVPFLRTAVEDDRVSTTLLGLWGSTAHHTPGLGCTLAEDRPAFAKPPALIRADPSAPWPRGESVTLPESAALDQALDVAFAEDDPDGRRRNTRAVVVVHDGQIVGERYADGFGPDVPMLGWSMAKSVANAMVGRLVADGRLALDRTDLLPRWEDDARSGISVRHLLQMASGLAFDEVYEAGTDATEMLYRPGDTGAFAADRPLEHEPGTHWSYSSGTTNVLCDVLQEASGLGVEMAHELVFAPLGMSSAVLEPDASGGLVCSSFLYATARDWARFGLWFLQEGAWDGQQLLPRDWVERTTRPVDLGTEEPYGLHWWLNEGPDGGLRMPALPSDTYWASGHDGQQVVVVPSEDLVVVRLGLSRDFDGIEWGLQVLVHTAIEAANAEGATF